MAEAKKKRYITIEVTTTKDRYVELANAICSVAGAMQYDALTYADQSINVDDLNVQFAQGLEDWKDTGEYANPPTLPPKKEAKPKKRPGKVG